MTVGPPAWCAPWVGLPWRERGRGPDGYDCWGLVRAVLRARCGLELPSHAGEYVDEATAQDLAAVVAGERDAWRPVDVANARAHDVVLLRLRGEPCHVGVVVAPGWMLHVTRGVNAACERLDGATWRNRVVGYFRHRALEVSHVG